MAEESSHVLLILIGRRDNAAMEAVCENQIAQGGRLMVIYITGDSRLSADFIDAIPQWNPPLAGHTHHWYQIGPGFHTLAEQETIRICSNGIMIVKEEACLPNAPVCYVEVVYSTAVSRPIAVRLPQDKVQFQVLGEVIIDPSAASKDGLSMVPNEMRSFGLSVQIRCLL